MRLARMPLSVLLAALALGTAVAGASATRLSLSSSNIRSVFSEVQVRVPEFEETLAICRVTLEGSFHGSTFAKAAESLIGYLTRAIAAHPCSTGDVFILNGAEVLPGGTRAPNSLPWHMRYENFTGSLPRPTGVRVSIIGASIQATLFGLSCLYRSTTANPVRIRFELAENGRVTAIRLDETARIVRFSGSELFCIPITFTGRGSATVLGTTTEVRITLI